MNYELKVMETIFKILIKNDFTWSAEFNTQMKIELVNLLLAYFENIEDFEKCTELHKILNKPEMIDENHNKTIATGSGKL